MRLLGRDETWSCPSERKVEQHITLSCVKDTAEVYVASKAGTVMLSAAS